MQVDLPLLRQSERTCFRRCPQQWWWSYREGLVPRRVNSGAAWFGTGIHLALAEWYIPGKKRGRDPLETWAEYTKDSYEAIKVQPDFVDEDFANWEDAKVLGQEMLEMYMEKYGEDSEWEVIAVEWRFAVTIPDPNNPKKAIAVDVGTFDLVIRHRVTGKIWLVDHKTCKAFEFKHLTIDDQGGSYCALATFALREAGLIGPKEAVSGIIYNFLRKQRRDTRPENELGQKLNKPEKKHYAAALAKNPDPADPAQADEKFWMKHTLAKLELTAEAQGLVVGGEVSKVQPKPIFYRHEVTRTLRERNKQIKRIGTEVSIMNKFRNGELPLYKNPTKDCAWQCDYFDLCELDETDGDMEDMKDMMFTVRDPYHDHREGAFNSKTSVVADAERKKIPSGAKP